MLLLHEGARLNLTGSRIVFALLRKAMQKPCHRTNPDSNARFCATAKFSGLGIVIEFNYLSADAERVLWR
jgi:hypothetical protein